jgi:phosphonate transport system permease protein
MLTMAHVAEPDHMGGLQQSSRTILDHYQSQVRTRRLYTVISIVVFLIVLGASLDFANSANSGKFFERLPYLFDFMKHFVPDSPLEIFRAMFDLPSPYADGSIKYDYVSDRIYITDTFYIPNFFYQLAITINVAIVSTIIGATGAFLLCFFASISAMIAVSIHTIGALGKLFFEVVENADMKPDEGLRASGASWLERVRFAIMPQVMPNFVSYTLLRLEINVRASTIIGAVGGGGIGEVFSLAIGRDHAAKTYAIIILLLITVVCVDQFSAWLRRRMIGKQSFEFGRGAA